MTKLSHLPAPRAEFVGRDSTLPGLAVAIPTYKRPELLEALLEDLAVQNCRPSEIVIVDGDPGSNAVLSRLRKRASSDAPHLHYIPSNHGNLPYQRYLGWKASAGLGARQIVYLDDDMRISNRDSLGQLVQPLLAQDTDTVGITAIIRFGKLEGATSEVGSVQDRYEGKHTARSPLVGRFGSSKGLPPGSLSPSGHRIPPNTLVGSNSVIHWLRGGVMAYRMSAIDESCFSETLFALARVGCGHGEDTLLSRRIGSRGKLHMMHQVILDHPNLDPPKAYATHAFRMAWGTAYSRRLINDDYRWPNRPIFSDRWALAKSHAGTSLIHTIAAIRRPRLHRFSYAAGYACGAVYAWIRPPDARHLAPGIRWRDDAAAALGSMIHL